MLRKTTLVLTLALGLCVPLAASAKDICVEDESGAAWVFRGVKKFKKHGKLVPVNGVYVAQFGQTGTIDGTAYRNDSGDVVLGVHILSPDIDTFRDRGFLGMLDDDFAGNMALAGTFPPTVLTLTGIDCDTVTLP